MTPSPTPLSSTIGQMLSWQSRVSRNALALVHHSSRLHQMAVTRVPVSCQDVAWITYAHAERKSWTFMASFENA